MTRSPTSLRPDARPLYAQTVDALMEMLADGTFPPGQYLPPEDALARQLGVSRSTIREAISHLEKDGLITRRQGIGTLVNIRSQEQMTGGLERLQSFRTLASIAHETVVVVERLVSLIPATPAVAAMLRVPSGEELAQLQVIEAINDRRMAVMDGVIPSRAVSLDELERGTGSLLDFLVEKSEIEFGVTRSTVSALDADAELARRMRVAEGKSVLHLSELLFTADDQPIALLSNYFLTEHFRFTIYRRVVKPRHVASAALPQGDRPS